MSEPLAQWMVEFDGSAAIKSVDDLVQALTGSIHQADEATKSISKSVMDMGALAQKGWDAWATGAERVRTENASAAIRETAQLAADCARVLEDEFAAAEKEAAEFAQALTGDIDRATSALQKQIDTYGLSAVEIKRWELAQRGATEAQLAGYDATIQQAKAMAENAKAASEAEKANKERQRQQEESMNVLKGFGVQAAGAAGVGEIAGALASATPALAAVSLALSALSSFKVNDEHGGIGAGGDISQEWQRVQQATAERDKAQITREGMLAILKQMAGMLGGLNQGISLA